MRFGILAGEMFGGLHLRCVVRWGSKKPFVISGRELDDICGHLGMAFGYLFVRVFLVIDLVVIAWIWYGVFF